MKKRKISTKGQITIPAEIRKKLGLEPNDKVSIRLLNDEIVLKPITKEDFFDLAGSVDHEGGEIDFDQMRESTKKSVAKSIIDESENE